MRSNFSLMKDNFGADAGGIAVGSPALAGFEARTRGKGVEMTG